MRGGTGGGAGRRKPRTRDGRLARAAGLGVVLVLVLAAFWLTGHSSAEHPATEEHAVATGTSHGGGSRSEAGSPGPGRTVLPVITESRLPAEAQQTLNLIRRGGPYPFSRDGIGFGNFEGGLPAEPSGYYREYTVATPGQSGRGARRIIVGKSGEKYYTGDHYQTFKLIQEER